MTTYVEILDTQYLVDAINIYRYGCLHSGRDNTGVIVYIDVWHKTLRQRIVQGVDKEHIRTFEEKEAFLLSMKDPVFNKLIYSSDFCDYAK